MNRILGTLTIALLVTASGACRASKPQQPRPDLEAITVDLRPTAVADTPGGGGTTVSPVKVGDKFKIGLGVGKLACAGANDTPIKVSTPSGCVIEGKTEGCAFNTQTQQCECDVVVTSTAGPCEGI